MMRIDWLQLGLGLLLSVATGWLSYRLGRLAPGGLVAVVLVGLFTFGIAGWHWGVPFLLYVLSSSLWWRHNVSRNLQRAGSTSRHEGSSQGWYEVWASVSWAATLALLHLFSPQTNAIVAAYIGALATMTGDSWATDVGMLAARSPRLITTGRGVATGTPGAVSALGVVAIVGGAWMIGFAALLSLVIEAGWERSAWDRGWLWLPFAATVGGLVGCFADSLLGAAAQAMYYCEHCQQRSEERVHTCGKEAQQLRGWTWLTNNGVNWLSSVVGAAVTMQVFLWVAQLSTRW
jgi:uncharacterized protein (TIGR00297 family)